MEFLAKSNGETLIDHTNNLLSQLKILKNTYPEILTRSDWELLQLACAYHDLGKINDKFQEKIRKNKWHIDGEIPHGLLSITLIPRKELEKKFSKEQVWVLINSVARHHKRDFEKINASDYKEEVDSLKPLEKELAKRIDKLKAPLELQDPKKVSHKYFNFKSQLLLENELKESDEDELKIRHKFDEYVKIKGLLNRLDYAASGHYKVESSPRVILSQNILQHWRKSEPQANWNEMQKWTFKHQNESIIVIGQTGLGKTEAALRWLGNEKSFFVLPLKSAINAIYHRIKNVVFNNESYNSLGLIHSDMISEAITEFGNQNNYSDFQKYVEEEKQWSKQLSIATLDQVFSFVYHYSNYEPQMATLAYSKVVIDEIQMYSPTLLAYIIYGLKEIQRYGGKFEIMTATLAPFILDLLNIHGLKFTMPEKPFLDSKINHRHNVKTIHAQLESKDILEKAQGKKTLVVCNTVQKANKLYLELKEVGVDVHLIHSRFIKKDRTIKENEIIHAGKTTNHNFEVWIGTQVVEASLDIDFDLLLTELSELNGLFQRMGRCYRKRNYKGEDPNVYIFDGGNKATSGIKRGQHSIVDWTMFNISKNAVKNLNGVLTEQDKIDLINTNYTSEKISVVDDNFISRVENSIKYLQDIEEAELIKKDIVSRFRGINNVDVIPEQVYLDNKVEITDKLIQLDRNKQKIRVLYKNENKNSNDITKLKIENLKLKNYLNSMTVSFPVYLLDKSNLVKNGDLQEVGYIILSKAFNYNSETGLSLNKSKEEEDDNFI